MEIALVNSVILNGGDAGIVLGTVDAIKEIMPHSRLTVFAHKARLAQRWYQELTLAEMACDTWPQSRYLVSFMRKSYAVRSSLGLLLSGERQFYQMLKRMDAIVYCGGGYVNDLYSLDVLARTMRDTLALGMPHMAYAHSFGPFWKEKSKRLVAELLSRFEAITTRDAQSLDLLHRLGVRAKKMQFTADAAFAMRIADERGMPAEDKNELHKILAFKHRGQTSPVLFISARAWHFPGVKDGSLLHQRYRMELCGFIRRLLSETDWRICLVSTCQGRPGYGFDDSQFAWSLVQDAGAAASHRIYTCRHAFNPRSYPYLIAKCADHVLTMRMHFMIFALMAGVAPISLAYERKTKELAEQIGMRDFCHDVRDFTGNDLWKSLVAVNRQKTQLDKKVSAECTRLKSRSLDNARILCQALLDDNQEISHQ